MNADMNSSASPVAHVAHVASVDDVVSASKRAAHRPPNRVAAVVMWPLWPLLDPHTGRPSASKCMAWAIYGATVAGKPFAAALAALLLSTCFGYAMFKDALAKASLNLTSTDSATLSAKFSKTVTEVRGVTGEALHSLAAKVGATTPAGDP